MSYTRNYNTIICDGCGKFCIPYDEETPYGCADPENPEPYEPYHYCKKCAKDLEKKWDERFKNASKEDLRLMGMYGKSKAEVKAAKKYGYSYVWSSGIGVLGSKKRWAEQHQYIPTKRYRELAKLPYYGWCKICGSKNANGYCSNKRCENSFQSKSVKRLAQEVLPL